MFRDVRMPRTDSADSQQPHTRSKEDNLITNIHTAYDRNYLRPLWKIHAANRHGQAEEQKMLHCDAKPQAISFTCIYIREGNFVLGNKINKKTTCSIIHINIIYYEV
jgi:hypothetical protein